MIHVLYFQAYLSLPEGTASVVGLIAMMTDHYTVLVRFKFNFNQGFGFSMPLSFYRYVSVVLIGRLWSLCLAPKCCFPFDLYAHRERERQNL